MNFLETISQSSLSLWVLQSSWAYYSLLAVHGIGMAGIVGSTFMLCLRVLGYARGVAVADLGRLRGVAWGGFLANAMSGAILFASDAPRLAFNGTFQVKIISIILGGIALGCLWRIIGRGPDKEEPYFSYGVGAKVAALATFAFWTSAIIFGRHIAYTLDPIL
ncbi:hypothetical protein WSK_1988, partial [Novosphingobium sp. Rr 2-17]|uniref:hypothetical protein n=1 Tax=Novosphingobium sp. Rr 2-17 TaxID=555793 RepID=UPI0002698501